MRSLLYVTIQHAAAVRTQAEALAVLTQYMVVSTNNHNNSASGTVHRSPHAMVEYLLHANVLPHLSNPRAKMYFLAHMVGVLLNHVFDAKIRLSQQFDKDFVGNKRVEVCGTLLGHLWFGMIPSSSQPKRQQLRNALYRMRGFVERNVASLGGPGWSSST